MSQKETGPARKRGARQRTQVFRRKLPACLPSILDASKAIRAEISGSDRCEALGIVAVSSSPVLLLCRKLVDSGIDPATPLEAWRGDTLCLLVRSIGEAATLRVNPHGTAFIRAEARPTAPPARFSSSPNGFDSPLTRRAA